jgi:orotidine-5'-phosphate decarboxylase
MDPVAERMSLDPSGNLGDQIERYFARILEAIHGRVSAVKPNLAYYLQYGGDGMQALQGLVGRARAMGLPVILDAKMGDIGRSSEAYARFAFQVAGADAVTLNPYMGRDSLQPFFRVPERGCYVIALTSNPGARTFQMEKIKPLTCLYEYVLQTICCWNAEWPSVGAVLGATQEGLGGGVGLIAESGCSLPLLIPGVGAQGGSYGAVRRVLAEKGYDAGLVRITASSAISYAHERLPGPVEEAAAAAVDELLRT